MRRSTGVMHYAHRKAHVGRSHHCSVPLVCSALQVHRQYRRTPTSLRRSLLPLIPHPSSLLRRTLASMRRSLLPLIPHPSSLLRRALASLRHSAKPTAANRMPGSRRGFSKPRATGSASHGNWRLTCCHRRITGSRTEAIRSACPCSVCPEKQARGYVDQHRRDRATANTALALSHLVLPAVCPKGLDAEDLTWTG